MYLFAKVSRRAIRNDRAVKTKGCGAEVLFHQRIVIVLSSAASVLSPTVKILLLHLEKRGRESPRAFAKAWVFFLFSG